MGQRGMLMGQRGDVDGTEGWDVSCKFVCHIYEINIVLHILYTIIPHQYITPQCAYTDSRGYRTVGIGFNLDAAGAQKKIEALGVNYHAVGWDLDICLYIFM